MEGINNHICYQIYKDLKGGGGLAVPCSPGRRLPPGSRSAPRRRLTLTHPPGSPHPAALNSLLLPWRTITQVNFFCRKKTTDNTVFLGDLKIILSLLNIQYPERPDMKLNSAAPPRGGLDQE